MEMRLKLCFRGEMSPPRGDGWDGVTFDQKDCTLQT